MHETFKRTYTKEEAQELIDWIDSTKPTGEIDLGQGVFISDLEKFANQIRHIAAEKYNNPTFSGQISLMMDVKERYKKG